MDFELFINSNDRVSGTPSNFVVALPHGRNIPEDMDEVQLVSVNMRNTQYAVNSNNNTFYCALFRYWDTLEAQIVFTVAVEIPVGNYTGDSLASILPGLVQNAWSAQQPLADLPTITASYDSNTQRFTVSVPSGAYGRGANPNNYDYYDWFAVLDGRAHSSFPNHGGLAYSYDSSVNRLMGFETLVYPPFAIGAFPPTYIDSDNISVSSTMETISSPNSILLCSDVLLPVSTTTSQITDYSQILHCVPLAGPGQHIFYEPISPKWHKLNNSSAITRLRIYWVDPTTYSTAQLMSNNDEQIIVLRFRSSRG